MSQYSSRVIHARCIAGLPMTDSAYAGKSAGGEYLRVLFCQRVGSSYLPMLFCVSINTFIASFSVSFYLQETGPGSSGKLPRKACVSIIPPVQPEDDPLLSGLLLIANMISYFASLINRKNIFVMSASDSFICFRHRAGSSEMSEAKLSYGIQSKGLFPHPDAFSRKLFLVFCRYYSSRSSRFSFSY